MSKKYHVQNVSSTSLIFRSAYDLHNELTVATDCKNLLIVIVKQTYEWLGQLILQFVEFYDL